MLLPAVAVPVASLQVNQGVGYGVEAAATCKVQGYAPNRAPSQGCGCTAAGTNRGYLPGRVLCRDGLHPGSFNCGGHFIVARRFEDLRQGRGGQQASVVWQRI